MNILITAIGSMSAECAIRSLKAQFDAFIIGVDIHPESITANAFLVDKFIQAPKASDEGYIKFINEICRKYNIKFVFPLTDPEIDTLHKNRECLHPNSLFALPNGKLISIARNKAKLYEFCKELKGCLTIETYLSIGALPADIKEFIAKPTNGRSSEGVFYFSQEDKSKVFFPANRDYVIQPFIAGDVVTVDVARDKQNNISIVARQEMVRSANGAGTVVKVYNSELRSLIKTIATQLALVGVINIEFIKTDDAYYLMDINPRFSAGIGFSHLAGYDFASNAVKALMGEAIAPLTSVNFGIYAKKYNDIKL